MAQSAQATAFGQAAEALQAALHEAFAAFLGSLAALLHGMDLGGCAAGAPGEQPAAEAVRHEGTDGADDFEGLPGVPEVFVLAGGDVVRGFVHGEDRLEVPAGAIGRTGGPLVDFATATADRDLRVATHVPDDPAAPVEQVVLLFADRHVSLIEGAVPLSASDWIFA